MKNYLGFLSMLLLLVSCKTQNLFIESKEELQDSKLEIDSTFFHNPDYEYTIRKYDKVNISVWGQDELSVGSVYGIYNSNEVYGKWLMVDARGCIEVPKIGTTRVEGKTVVELKDTLRGVFQRWIKTPIVDVKILNKEITVLGEVKNPGVIKVDTDRNTLLDMIAQTGGFDFYANLECVKILRQEGPDVRVVNIDLTEAGIFLQKNIQLHPGDIVIVPSKSYKEFDKRVSIIIPLTSTVSASAIVLGLL
ncbi:MAG: polysaccharide export outer membrane protein [Saprospiraceae bacterium]|jgi:polysaccharide export outer membrane protein